MLLTRIITVVVAVPILIVLIVSPITWLFKLVVQAALSLALLEYSKIVGFSRSQSGFIIIIGTLHGLFLLFGPVSDWLLQELVLLIFISFLYYLKKHTEEMEGGTAGRLGLHLLGIIYVITLGAFIGVMRDLSNGVFWIFILLASCWLNDTFAYLFGHWFGKRRLAPMISPGKTVEGFLGGFIGSVAGFLIFWFIYKSDLLLTQGLFLAMLTGFTAPIGDLAESLIKRSFHVKDSGRLIPGHGGMLDRIDSLLFTAPLVYYFALRFYG